MQKGFWAYLLSQCMHMLSHTESSLALPAALQITLVLTSQNATSEYWSARGM